MMKYTFYVTTSQSGGEGQVDTQTYNGTDRQSNIYGTYRQTYGNIENTYNHIGI